MEVKRAFRSSLGVKGVENLVQIGTYPLPVTGRKAKQYSKLPHLDLELTKHERDTQFIDMFLMKRVKASLQGFP